MKSRAGLAIRTLLAITIVIAAVPVHGATAAMILSEIDTGKVSAETEAEHDRDAQQPRAQHDCQTDSNESVDTQACGQQCAEEKGCTTTDCRCACPGLTLVMPLKLPPALIAPAPDAPAGVNRFLTSVNTEGLLRPPQA